MDVFVLYILLEIERYKMKLSTNKIIIIFGILVLGMMAIFPISFVAAQVLNPQPNNDPQATVQAMVTQTMLALTLNAPTQTPLPPIIVPATNTYTHAHIHTYSHRHNRFVL